LAVAKSRILVQGRLGELTHPCRTQRERKRSDSVSGAQGEARHGGPLNQTTGDALVRTDREQLSRRSSETGLRTWP
jgi:hypothetical protein